MVRINFRKDKLQGGETIRTVYIDKVDVDLVEKRIHFSMNGKFWEHVRFKEILFNHVSNSDYHQIEVLQDPKVVPDDCDRFCEECPNMSECLLKDGV